MKTPEGFKQFNILLPEDLWWKIKKIVVDEKTTKEAWGAEALTRAVAGYAGKPHNNGGEIIHQTPKGRFGVRRPPEAGESGKTKNG